MRTLLHLIAAIALLAPLAGAQSQPQIDAIVASTPQPGEPADDVWELTRAELQRDYPAVLRAIEQPDFVTEVSDAEEPAVQAFFDGMSQRNATAVRVDGNLYTVGITLAQGLPPGSLPAGDGEAEKKGAPGAGVLAILGTLAVAGLSLKRRIL